MLMSKISQPLVLKMSNNEDQPYDSLEQLQYPCWNSQNAQYYIIMYIEFPNKNFFKKVFPKSLILNSTNWFMHSNEYA